MPAVMRLSSTTPKPVPTDDHATLVCMCNCVYDKLCYCKYVVNIFSQQSNTNICKHVGQCRLQCRCIEHKRHFDRQLGLQSKYSN